MLPHTHTRLTTCALKNWTLTLWHNQVWTESVTTSPEVGKASLDGVAHRICRESRIHLRSGDIGRRCSADLCGITHLPALSALVSGSTLNLWPLTGDKGVQSSLEGVPQLIVVPLAFWRQIEGVVQLICAESLICRRYGVGLRICAALTGDKDKRRNRHVALNLPLQNKANKETALRPFHTQPHQLSD